MGNVAPFIAPFNEDFLALYDELKRIFKEDFDFTNAGDLDNQQNISQRWKTALSLLRI